jgi:ABC-type bacteriocin/lantibiotic exporter with double-glycine peptidase domain
MEVSRISHKQFPIPFDIRIFITYYNIKISLQIIFNIHYAGGEKMYRTIYLKNVSKSYGEGENAFHALKNVTLSFRCEETTLITGASGSGKSTLLNMISTLETPTSGEVFYDDQKMWV